MKQRNGFTLLELLVVVTILSILALSVFVALDPIRQFAEARNARRWNDVNNISTAVSRYLIEKKELPPGISKTPTQIAASTGGCQSTCISSQDSCLQLIPVLKDYLDPFPTDPKSGTTQYSGYMIQLNDNSSITVSACNAEQGATIKITR